MSRISGHNFVVGRKESLGEIQDVEIRNNAEGLTEINVARDPSLVEKRNYVVDRRILPEGSWQRLLEVESFSNDEDPENISETRAEVDYEQIANEWNFEYERTYGLPSGMESPWNQPLEMIANELLVSDDTHWVSGDAPINIDVNNTFRNGKYTVHVEDGRIVFECGNEILGTIICDTRNINWTDGVAGAASFRGGSVYIEPAKPPTFTGSFNLDREPIYEAPGLYRYGDNFLISTNVIYGNSGVGTISFLKDPFPRRWVKRMMGRSYVTLITPASVPPYVEDRPKRISIGVHYPDNDFPDITPVVRTPYADESGVFNVWDIEETEVNSSARERPYEVYLPLETSEDWGGHFSISVGDHYPVTDFRGQPRAAVPTTNGYELAPIPHIPEGTLFFRWRDSVQWTPLRTEQLQVEYKEGYFYFTDRDNQENDGIARYNPVDSNWNHTKIEWGPAGLFINDEPGIQEEIPWGYYENKTWSKVLNYYPTSTWSPNPDIPLTIEQFEDRPTTWVTGKPEGEVERPFLDYDERPRTWGRVLFEGFEELPDPNTVLAPGSSLPLTDVGDIDLSDFYGQIDAESNQPLSEILNRPLNDI